MSSTNSMILYHLTIKPSGHNRGLLYDISVAFVVRAPNENKARQICQQNGGDETRMHNDNGMLIFSSSGGPVDYPFWTNSDFTDCIFLGTAGDQNSDSGVICRDFNAG